MGKRGTASRWRQRVEFLLLRGVASVFTLLPRGISLRAGVAIGRGTYFLLSRLRSVGMRNLAIAFPQRSLEDRQAVLKEAFGHLGRQVAEFCRMPLYSRSGASKWIRYEGLRNYQAAMEKGRGVFVLTAHLGAWELSSFYHSLMGWPMDIVIRRLDNPMLDAWVNGIRCLHGNRVLHKDDFARGLIASMRGGRAVGVLMDTNMTPPQGVFVPFFGVAACTGSGVARIVQKTGATVLAGFLLWEKEERKYVLRFGEEIELATTGDPDEDAVTNTARMTLVVESYVRQYPEQWLWMHRRWKTRPPGEPAIYSS